MGKLAASFALAAGLVAADVKGQTVAKKPQTALQQATERTAREKAAKGDNSKFMTRAAEETTATAQPGDVNISAPYWQPIMQTGDMVDYFRYHGLNRATTIDEANSPLFNQEIRDSVTATRPGEDFAYQFQPSVLTAPESKFAGCELRNQPEKQIYWFDPSTGVNLGANADTNPFYRTALPSEFNISPAHSGYGVRGFTVQGGIDGDAPKSPDGSFALAVMYVTDRRCSDGNNEYGFWKDLSSTEKKNPETGEVVPHNPEDVPLKFYYSTRTNCFRGWGCRAEDDVNGPTKEQETSTVTEITKIKNYDIRTPEEVAAGVPLRAPNFYYSAYMVPDAAPDAEHNSGLKFRLQVVDAYHPDRLATCSIDGGPEGPCATEVKIENFFPAQEMIRNQSFAVTGTQTSTSSEEHGIDRTPRLTKDAKFRVQGVYLGK
jgi:hypothetical protein